MKKLRNFFVVAVLMLVMLGFFAGRATYFDTYQLWGYNSTSGYVAMLCGNPWFCTGGKMEIGVSGSTPATVSSGLIAYSLYAYDTNVGSYLPVILR